MTLFVAHMHKSLVRKVYVCGLCSYLLAGCVPFPRLFQGAKPIYPEMGYSYAGRFNTVDSLQPELKWEDIKKSGQTYDVCIWEDTGTAMLNTGPTQTGLPSDVFFDTPGISTSWGKVVYCQYNIPENSHRVKQALKPDTLYNWSVRIRQGDQITKWSTFVQHVSEFAVAARYSNVPYGFRTPKATTS